MAERDQGQLGDATSAAGPEPVEELIAELVSLAIQIAQVTWREPWFALAELRTILKMMAYDREGVISESARTRKPVAWYGDSPPRQADVVWCRRPSRPEHSGGAKVRPMLRPIQRRREPRRPRHTRRTALASRDGPSRPSGDDPPLPPDLTPLQRAFGLFLAALQIAREAGEPVFPVFLNLAAIRVAHELAPLLRWQKDAA